MKTRYWDSVVWLGILNEEPDKLPTCSQLFEEAKRGDYVIVCSAITLTEVVHLHGFPRMSPEKEDKITAFFEHDCIKVRGLDRGTAELARHLIWQFNDQSKKPNERLKPKDAIHVATAVLANVDVLNSYDQDLINLNGQLNCKNGNVLKIEEPKISQPRLLPHSA